MTRMEKIQAYIQQCYRDKTVSPNGITAMEVANALGIWRNDASKDLNALVKEGYLGRTATRPVYFFLPNAEKPAAQQEVLNCHLSEKEVAQSQQKSAPEGPLPEVVLPLLEADPPLSPRDFDQNNGECLVEAEKSQDGFQAFIGYSGSLRLQIAAAKTAALYPPNGIHTLIVGETGVGKTMLAKCMHQYMKTVRQDPNIPFISFNCAEYADNPQLLLAQLFGYEKGSYTGATTTKSGLINEANGGVLFLDEIHRLSPVGQEMFFSVIDRGQYRRLGGYTSHPANLMIIGATTENISSTLLATFNRRFPVTIRVPSLDERPICERMDMILNFFLTEVRRFRMPLKITLTAMKLLLGYRSSANVGDLKNTIQICCAKGYYRSMKNGTGQGLGIIEISPSDISRDIQSAYTYPDQIDRYCNLLMRSKEIIIHPDYEMQDILDQMDEELYKLNKKFTGFFTLGSQKSPSGCLNEYIRLQEELGERFADCVLGAIPTAYLQHARQLIREAEEELETSYEKDAACSVAYFLHEIISCANGGITLASEYLVAEPGYESPESAFLEKKTNAIHSLFGVHLTHSEQILLTMTLRQYRIHPENIPECLTQETPQHVSLLLAVRGSTTAAAAADRINMSFHEELAHALNLGKHIPDSLALSQISAYLNPLPDNTVVIVLTNLNCIHQDFLKAHQRLQISVVRKYNIFLAFEAAQQLSAFRSSSGNTEKLFNSIRNLSYIGELSLPDSLIPAENYKFPQKRK